MATELVWQWVEARGIPVYEILFEYFGDHIDCCIELQGHPKYYAADGRGTTWPEALCRAALALAEALEARKEGNDEQGVHNPAHE